MIPKKDAPLGPDWAPRAVRKSASWATFGVFDDAATKHDFYFGKDTSLTMEEANDLFKKDIKEAWRSLESDTILRAMKRQYCRGSGHLFYFLVTKFGRLSYEGNEAEILAMRIIKRDRAKDKAELAKLSAERSELYARLKKKDKIIEMLEREKIREVGALEEFKTNELDKKAS